MSPVASALQAGEIVDDDLNRVLINPLPTVGGEGGGACRGKRATAGVPTLCGQRPPRRRWALQLKRSPAHARLGAPSRPPCRV